jgi:hypothetical protein
MLTFDNIPARHEPGLSQAACQWITTQLAFSQGLPRPANRGSRDPRHTCLERRWNSTTLPGFLAGGRQAMDRGRSEAQVGSATERLASRVVPGGEQIPFRHEAPRPGPRRTRIY